MTQSARPRILLLGAHGQLGYELRRSLRPQGEVIAAARRPQPGEVQADLADHAGLAKLIQELKPALVVNAAAYTLVDQAEQEPELARAVNAVAPGVVQEAARAVGAAAVHYSTDYVFAGAGSDPHDEDDEPSPLGVYGRTKLAGERAVAEAGGAYVILRTSWVYGVHGANFVKKILKLAAEREQLRIVDDQVGAPTSARVLADVTAQLLAKSSTPDGFARLAEVAGVYHACCAGETTWCRFTTELVARAREAGVALGVKEIAPIKTSEFPTPAARPLNSRLSCRKIERQFGLFLPTWQEALDDTLPPILEGLTARQPG